jgi:hypothetical protein
MDAPVPSSYRRLPGRTAWLRFGGISAPSTSLWLGADHLLKIERSASRESYKRFFYRDIQSIFVEQSSRRSSVLIFNVGVLAVIVLITAAIGSLSAAALTTAALIASPFVVGLIVNLALGTTSQAVVVTAVGTERLSSLSRLARSEEAVRLLAAEITKVQGDLPRAQLLLRWPASVASPPAA